jgi:hypothetical protein
MATDYLRNHSNHIGPYTIWNSLPWVHKFNFSVISRSHWLKLYGYVLQWHRELEYNKKILRWDEVSLDNIYILKFSNKDKCDMQLVWSNIYIISISYKSDFFMRLSHKESYLYTATVTSQLEVLDHKRSWDWKFCGENEQNMKPWQERKSYIIKQVSSTKYSISRTIISHHSNLWWNVSQHDLMKIDAKKFD